MATITECDGCGTRIGRPTSQCLVGNLTGADGIPHGLHWCRNCADIAVKAVRLANQPAGHSEEDIIRDAMAEAQEHPGRIVTR